MGLQVCAYSDVSLGSGSVFNEAVLVLALGIGFEVFRVWCLCVCVTPHVSQHCALQSRCVGPMAWSYIYMCVLFLRQHAAAYGAGAMHISGVWHCV